ncbi:hypothetical protein [Clostridium algidicarnis]|uniref:hypothetical protein n=1 Tax=Clostridium algidicarnis TaxID=37659 RepID=UPI001C0B40F1|nr:hypothetical protein [Clostridium algidicarnis]MBU3203859.1 hypothetical protein [Clostridium algidicarnis]MBU3212013.1 hypothetical protein [Clostridium algidicarnis]MBU3221481.1 hypothetical protein [Clostridium algidicarnis]
MSITRDEFIPRPGVVNKQGYLPDPEELVCIEVPKVFDQCLIKRCLIFDDGPDTDDTDEELRSDPIDNPRIFIGCRDFDLKLCSVEKFPIAGKPGFKKVIISFVISFFADFIDTCGKTQNELFEISRTEVIPKLYCPDSIAQISASFVPVCNSRDLDPEIVKLEMVAECLDGTFTCDCDGNEVLDVTLGFHLIVKCELIVQLLIPAYGYCPVPNQCDEEPEENPCERFERAPVPKFFPDQMLDPLFCNCSEDDD